MKKALNLFIFLLLTAIPAHTKDFEYEGIWYTVLDEQAKTCGTRAGTDKDHPGNSFAGELELPEKASDGLTEYTVTSIGDWSFAGQKDLNYLTLPESMETLGVGAFYSCGFQSVDIPFGVRKIPVYAFSFTPLKTAFLPPSVAEVHTNSPYLVTDANHSEWVNENPFLLTQDGKNATYASVVYPKGLDFKHSDNNYYDNWVFKDGFLLSKDGSALMHIPFRFKGFISIPESVTMISRFCDVNHRSPHLKVIDCRTVETIYARIDDTCPVVFVGDHFELQGSYNVKCVQCPLKQKRLSYEDDCLYIFANDGSSVELIYTDEQVSFDKLRTDITDIRGYAFYKNQYLTDITLPINVKSIAGRSFSECPHLKSVVIPAGCEIIGGEVLRRPSLGNSYYLETTPFNDCPNLETLIFREGVENLNGFNNCPSIKSVSFPSTLRYLGGFNGTGLSEISFPEGFLSLNPGKMLKQETSLGFNEDSGTLCDCPYLTEAHFPVSFAGPDETNFIAIPNKCFVNTPLEVLSFKGRPFPRDIDIRAWEAAELFSTTHIQVGGEYLFDYLLHPFFSKFSNIECEGRVCTRFNDDVFSYILNPVSNEAILLAQDSNLAMATVSIPNRVVYEEAGTSRFLNVVMIGAEAFKSSVNLSKIVFPKNLRRIGQSAFEGCTNLTHLNLPSSLEILDKKALCNTGITELVIPEGMKAIKERGLYGNQSLKTIDFTNAGNLELYTSALEGNTLLEEICLPPGVRIHKSHSMQWDGSITELNDFSIAAGCSNLKKVVWPGTMQTVPRSCFQNCKALEYVILGEGIKEIDSQAFFYCESLKNINLVDGIESIGFRAFSKCPLKQIRIPSSVTKIHYYAFKGCDMVETVRFEDSATKIECVPPSTLQPEYLYGIFSDAKPKEIYFGRPLWSWSQENEGEDGNGIRHLTGIPKICDFSNLETVTVGNTIEYMMDGIFSECSKLATVTLGSGLKEIPAHAFQGSALSETVIPSSVVTIGTSAFQDNKLDCVVMGAGIREIGAECFSGNDNLSTVSITALDPPMATNDAFSYYGGSLYVMPGCQNDYENYPRCWYRFNSFDLIPVDEVKSEISANLPYAPGTTQQLSVKVIPENASLPQIFWESTNMDIATVDNNGLVTYHDINNGGDEYEAKGTVGNKVCKIIARTLYADGPVAEFNINIDDSGIHGIVKEDLGGKIDFSQPVEVYDLRGVRVATSIEGLLPGFYILRQGNVAEKTLVR